MANRTTMNISVTGPMAKFVSRQVKTGRYQTASEVVREGLRILEDRQRERAVALASVKRKIAVGLRQAEEGRLIDSKDVLRRMHSRIATPKRKAG